ncbi:hypothetical protein niasHT_003084 [Heterodera trifolii]|uniref:Uncharacterized protein n=1 Tax=Heterodera trifolii TaxID=157864 RepID=A0ABD2M5I9_9BILA
MTTISLQLAKKGRHSPIEKMGQTQAHNPTMILPWTAEKERRRSIVLMELPEPTGNKSSAERVPTDQTAVSTELGIDCPISNYLPPTF